MDLQTVDDKPVSTIVATRWNARRGEIRPPVRPAAARDDGEGGVAGAVGGRSTRAWKAGRGEQIVPESGGFPGVSAF